MLRTLQVIGTLAVILTLDAAPMFAQTPSSTGSTPTAGGSMTTTAPARPRRRIGRRVRSKRYTNIKSTAPATTTPATTPAQ
jgi:hypothetical protein